MLETIKFMPNLTTTHFLVQGEKQTVLSPSHLLIVPVNVRLAYKLLSLDRFPGRSAEPWKKLFRLVTAPCCNRPRVVSKQTQQPSRPPNRLQSISITKM